MRNLFNLDKMDKYTKKHNLPKLTQQEREKSEYRHTENHSSKWCQFFQTLMEEIMPISHKPFQKIEKEQTLLNSLMTPV